MVQHSSFMVRGFALLASILALAVAAQAQTPAPAPAPAPAPVPAPTLKHAQSVPMAAAAQADPLDPRAAVPAFIYQSAFAPYRALGSQELISWRQANDNVARIGGWRVYLRQAQQPEPPSPAEQPMTTKPAEAQADVKPEAAHGGHRSHGNHGGHSGRSTP